MTHQWKRMFKKYLDWKEITFSKALTSSFLDYTLSSSLKIFDALWPIFRTTNFTLSHVFPIIQKTWLKKCKYTEKKVHRAHNELSDTKSERCITATLTSLGTEVQHNLHTPCTTTVHSENFCLTEKDISVEKPIKVAFGSICGKTPLSRKSLSSSSLFFHFHLTIIKLKIYFYIFHF